MIDRPAIIGTSSAALVPNGYAVHAGGGGGGGAIRVDQLGAGELSQLELTTLFGRTHLGLAACDASGEMTFLSPALQELLGQPFRPHAEAEQVERYHLSEGDGSTRLRAEEVPLARARLGETVTDAVICSRSNTGNLLYLLCNALPVRCPEGSLLGAVVLVQDVTAQHVMLQEQEQLRNHLVVSLNHEFRTPLTKLVGYAEILHDLSEDFPPEAVHFLEKIRKAADNLTAMVDAVTILADLQTSNRPRGGLGEYTAARDEVAQSSASARRTIANSPGAHRRTRP